MICSSVVVNDRIVVMGTVLSVRDLEGFYREGHQVAVIQKPGTARPAGFHAQP
ncbi:MAG: hypothetical protein ABIB93_01835 [Chloroflexota bacterium]